MSADTLATLGGVALVVIGFAILAGLWDVIETIYKIDKNTRRKK